MEKFGKLYSTTSDPNIKGVSFIVWDRYPSSLSKRRDRFALYLSSGEYIDHFHSAISAEREASFRLSDMTEPK